MHLPPDRPRLRHPGLHRPRGVSRRGAGCRRPGGLRAHLRRTPGPGRRTPHRPDATLVKRTDTTVGIVGGGPAGLMLSHLLQVSGIESVVIETRTREEIEHTHRAGILERDSVRLLVDSGVSDRVLREGHEHRGIDLRFGGSSHRIDFQGLVGASTWLYPQTDVFLDLANARERAGGDVRFGVTDTAVVDLTSDRPGILFTSADG